MASTVQKRVLGVEIDLKATTMECVPTKYKKIAEACLRLERQLVKDQRGNTKGARHGRRLRCRRSLIPFFGSIQSPPIFLHEIKTHGLGERRQSGTNRRWASQTHPCIKLSSSRNKFSLLDACDKRLKLPNSLRQLPAPWGQAAVS